MKQRIFGSGDTRHNQRYRDYTKIRLLRERQYIECKDLEEFYAFLSQTLATRPLPITEKIRRTFTGECDQLKGKILKVLPLCYIAIIIVQQIIISLSLSPHTTITVPGLYERNTCLHPTDAEFAKGLQCCLSLRYFGCFPCSNN